MNSVSIDHSLPMQAIRRVAAIVALSTLFSSGCANDNPTPNVYTTSLSPEQPNSERRLGWSPKAASVPLHPVTNGLEGAIQLGSADAEPFRVRLEKSSGAQYFDKLLVDKNRDGNFAESEALVTTPNEVRNKMWSSFTTELSVTIADSTDGTVTSNPYPISLWFVEDPREDKLDLALRFTRSGWMQGRIAISGVDAHIRISESVLDGRFTLEDEWTIAEPDSIENLYSFRHDRPLQRHAWLGERAFRIVSLSQDGRSVSIEPIDPGVTRSQEAEDDDQLAVDRRAPRSGNSISFRRDFSAAEADAKTSGKPLFIDFETVWCGPCKTMDEWVYSADAVVDAAQGVVAVKVDGDDFPDLTERFDVSGYPTMLLVAPDGTVMNRLTGYQGVDTMAAFLAADPQ